MEFSFNIGIATKPNSKAGYLISTDPYDFQTTRIFNNVCIGYSTFLDVFFSGASVASNRIWVYNNVATSSRVVAIDGDQPDAIHANSTVTSTQLSLDGNNFYNFRYDWFNWSTVSDQTNLATNRILTNPIAQ